MEFTADQLVERFLRQQMAEYLPDNHHLRNCDQVEFHHELSNGSWDCDTGCEYARLKAQAICPHGEKHLVHYGEFGDISSIIETLTDWAEDGEI